MGNLNSGRRPQSTALKLLRGNPGKRKLNPQEPIPPVAPIVKPTLSRTAGLVWDRLAPTAIAMGTLTAADVTAFATLCELQATLESAWAQKDAPVVIIATTSCGEDAPPAEQAAADLADAVTAAALLVVGAIKLEKEFAPIVRQYYALFGLEPVSRAKIHLPKPTEAPAISKWAGILK